MTQPTRDPNRLPTSADPSGHCPRCGVFAAFQHITHNDLETLFSDAPPPPGVHPARNYRVTELVSVLQCMHCDGRIVVVEAEMNNQTGLKPAMYWPTEHLGDLVHIAGVPPAVVEAYSEGVCCLGVQSPNAAGAMFRTVLAQIIKDKGSEAAKSKRTLDQAIQQVEADGTMWPEFGDWAHHVRRTGNAGAHNEAFEALTMDQAIALREFIRQMINFLYVQPSNRSAALPVMRRASAAANQPTGSADTQGSGQQ